jgi:hypothetical protein
MSDPPDPDATGTDHPPPLLIPAGESFAPVAVRRPVPNRHGPEQGVTWTFPGTSGRLHRGRGVRVLT